MATELPVRLKYLFPTLEFLIKINQTGRMPKLYSIEGTVQVDIREEEVRAFHQVGRTWELWWSCPVATEVGRDGVLALRLSTEMAKSGFIGSGQNYPRIKSMRLVTPREEEGSDDEMASGEDAVPKSDVSDDNGRSPAISSSDEAGQKPGLGSQPLPGPSGTQGSEMAPIRGASMPARQRLTLSLHKPPELVVISSSSESQDSPSLLEPKKEDK